MFRNRRRASLALVAVLLAGAALSACDTQGGPTVATRPTDGAATPAPTRTAPIGPPEIPTPRPTPVGSFRYALQAGDTFAVLAERFGTTVEEIIAVNPGIDPVGLFPGDEITIPGPGAG